MAADSFSSSVLKDIEREKERIFLHFQRAIKKRSWKDSFFICIYFWEFENSERHSSHYHHLHLHHHNRISTHRRKKGTGGKNVDDFDFLFLTLHNTTLTVTDITCMYVYR